MKNLILYGDSLFGRFNRDRVLDFESKAKDWLIYNCAVGGSDTRDGLKHAEFIARLGADCVCLSFGANDCNPEKGSPVSIQAFENNLSKILTIFSDSKIIIFPCPPVYDPEDSDGTTEFNSLLDIYNQVVAKVARTANAITLDSSVYREMMVRGENYHEPDGLHLNALGYSTLIELLLKAL